MPAAGLPRCLRQPSTPPRRSAVPHAHSERAGGHPRRTAPAGRGGVAPAARAARLPAPVPGAPAAGQRAAPGQRAAVRRRRRRLLAAAVLPRPHGLPHAALQLQALTLPGAAPPHPRSRSMATCARLVSEQEVQALSIDAATANVEAHYAYICTAFSAFTQRYGAQRAAHAGAARRWRWHAPERPAPPASCPLCIVRPTPTPPQPCSPPNMRRRAGPLRVRPALPGGHGAAPRPA